MTRKQVLAPKRKLPGTTTPRSVGWYCRHSEVVQLTIKTTALTMQEAHHYLSTRYNREHSKVFFITRQGTAIRTNNLHSFNIQECRQTVFVYC